MKDKIWTKREAEASIVSDIQKSCNISEFLARMLVKRGITNFSEAEKFLNPELSLISSPFTLKDMEKAVQRIERAKGKETICIYGDYDVDGMTSTSLLLIGLRQLGFTVTHYIPKREEGYGVNCDALTKIREFATLAITVDCGINAEKEALHAKGIGLDLIITDHHEINTTLPEAYAIINPKRVENVYKFQSLAGVGTAFMLLYALFLSMNGNLDDLFSLLDIVSIGTISDVVPLVSENRIFVKHGSKYIQNSSNIGLQIIKKNLFANKDISAIDIGFKIAPLLNAAGRLESPETVIELLTTLDKERASQLFDKLAKLNRTRQEMGRDMFELVEQNVDSSKNIIICHSKEFHQGLIGIIAAKLCDKYSLPSIVLKEKEDGTASGSARATKNVNLVNMLSQCSDLLIKFGGHAKAAGLSVKLEDIPALKERLEEICTRELTEEDKLKVVEIEEELKDFQISLEADKDIQKLRPFGYGNPEPIFFIKDVSISGVRKIGKDKHLMFDLKSFGGSIKNAVWFNNLSHISEEKYDVAFKLEENFFNGRKFPKIYVEDIRLSESSSCPIEYHRELYKVYFPLRTSFLTQEIVPLGKATLDINSRVSLQRKNRTIGILNNEVSYILKELDKNHFFRFEAEIVDSKTLDHLENIYEYDLVIKRSYEVEKKDNLKDTLIEIKKMLIGDYEYNSIQKQILRRILIDTKSTTLLSKKGRGIKTIATAIAAFFYLEYGKKSLFVTNEKNISNLIQRYFHVISPEENINEDVPFTFIDNVPYESKSVFFKFSNDLKEVHDIIDELKLEENILIVPQSQGRAFNRSMQLSEKRAFLQNLKDGKESIAEKDLLAFL